MKMRWHHLVTYTASRCLPPPQPQSMSMPLSHCLVDCCLSPSSWPTTTIIVVISILHLLASFFIPLLPCVPPPSSPIFCRGRVLFGVVTLATSVAATASVSLPPPYYVDCCVLTVVVVVCCCLVSLSIHPPLRWSRCRLVRQDLPQPSSTSSSKPPLHPSTLTKGDLFYCCVLFCCCVVSPSSSGGGHPAHCIRHRRSRCRPLSLSSLSWPQPLSSSSLSS